MNRRAFVKVSGAGTAALLGRPAFEANGQKALEAEVVNPFNRVPVSLIIDDSTCLVNMAHFGIPQFGEVFPDQYRQDWRKLPREIPDSFVREFGEWSAENGVKGKYSIVPYPACTGWINRFIPGWTKKELDESLRLVRELIMPNWDIHPEMVSHTRVINIKTGQPYPYATPEYMENWQWSQDKSADELASYQAYALSVLKESGLDCEGLTTPGGYGGRNQENLAIGTFESLRSVYGSEIPHYFRDLFTEKDESVAPRLKLMPGHSASDPRCAVSVIGCTGDWFGGWDGLVPGDVNKFIAEDLASGRMVEVIDSGEPAIMVCHWPGIYFNGEKTGFNILKEIKRRLDQKYDNLIWMKLGEIARYWAARELTTIEVQDNKLVLRAPFAAPDFTLRLSPKIRNPRIIAEGGEKPFTRISNINLLKEGTFISDNEGSVLCFGLNKGINEILF